MHVIFYDIVTENRVSWSYHGRTAPADKTTMKLSFTGRRRDEYKLVILHEFGHALGLIHEHQHEDAPIVYNDQKLKEYVKDALIHQNRSHSPADVEKEIKDQWGKMTGGFSGFGKPLCGPYDKESVMHYV